MVPPFIVIMSRLLILLIFLLASQGNAQPLSIIIPAHPSESASNGPSSLNALLWKPKSAPPHAAVVLLHGCAGLRNRDGQPFSRDSDWARRLSDLGYMALQVDSLSPRGEVSLCGQGFERRVRMSVERARDAYAGLLFLQSRDDVDPRRIALMGWSNGGGTTLWTLSERSRARPPTLSNDFVAGIAFYPGCRSLSQLSVAWRPVAPILLIVGEADDWTPAAPCRFLSRDRDPRVEVHFYAGAHHGFDTPDLPQRVLSGIGSTASGTATIGTHSAAREDALRRVPEFLAHIANAR